MSVDEGLAAHWTFSGDASGKELQLDVTDVDFAVEGPGGRLSTAAGFNGTSSRIEVPSSSLDLGSGDFTIATWLHTDKQLDDIIGDIASCYNPDTRTGFNFGILNNAGVTAAQSNYRQVHFGIDNGSESSWINCGRPGNNLRVYSLCVFDQDLYAGTFETGTDEQGHVYRYAGSKEWIDCGFPDPANTAASLCVYNDQLYAGSSRYQAGGSALPDSENQQEGANMYRYLGDSQWEPIGHLKGADSVAGMAVYNGQLYAIPLYSQGVFRYDGGSTWTHVGSPGRRMMSLGVYNGHLYGAGNEGEEKGGVFRYAGGSTWKHAGGQEGVTQTYSFVVHKGKFYCGTWPDGKVFRYDGSDSWTSVGRLGEELEVMAMAVYNGKLYAGTLPLGKVFRYDGQNTWTDTGQLDVTPDVKYRRVWSMAIYQGKLFGGTLPSGHVYSLEVGKNVTYDRVLAAGWHHLAAVREGGTLKLYIDGASVAATLDADLRFNTDRPFMIGFGAQDHLKGRLSDFRIYNRGLRVSEIGILSKL